VAPIVIFGPSMQTIDLTHVFGGNGNPEQLRSLAQRWCPQTAARYQNTAITRPIAERCLSEAGLSQYSNRLDQYFPRR
jgi:hypothetical protein